MALGHTPKDIADLEAALTMCEQRAEGLFAQARSESFEGAQARATQGIGYVALAAHWFERLKRAEQAMYIDNALAEQQRQLLENTITAMEARQEQDAK